MAKAPNENGSDGEERKLGEQTGLDRAFCRNSSSCKKTSEIHSSETFTS